MDWVKYESKECLRKEDGKLVDLYSISLIIFLDWMQCTYPDGTYPYGVLRTCPYKGTIGGVRMTHSDCFSGGLLADWPKHHRRRSMHLRA